MIKQDYDADAGALYVKLASRKVARTIEIDSGTLADLDSAGRLVGIEVIEPDRAWPLEDILTRFGVSAQDARELRQRYGQRSPKGGQAPGHPVKRGLLLAIAAGVGAAAVKVIRAILRAPVG